uniref:Gnk2-homologous domain-containing protein n=1 Tax=Aegilops tauschii subsp. strangulata TaxID=200361 RepID=A0A453KWU4_AEGTS
RASCGLRKEVTIFYNLCTLVISSDMIKWTSRVGSLVEQVDNTTVQSKAFDTGISALIAGVAGMAANMSGRFATAVEEINIDGTKYTAYGLAQCVPELTTAECGCCLNDLWSASSLTGWSGQRSASPWCSYQFHLQKFFNGEPMQTFATL